MRPVLARTAAVRGGAVVGLRRFGGQYATDRFAFTWIGGIDPKRSIASTYFVTVLPSNQTFVWIVHRVIA